MGWGACSAAALALTALTSGAGYLAWNRVSDHAHARDAFEAFIARYGRVYESRAEKLRRFGIFLENLAFIEVENAKNHSYTLGINQFADMTPDELGLGHRPLPRENPWAGLPHLGTHMYSGVELPSSVDWAAKGAVTGVKNQAQCGSCWAFSTTGALEGAWKIASGKLVSLSEQQLVDCSHNGNQGCQGGSMELAFQWVESHGLCTEGSYPYTAKDGSCKAKCTVGLPKGAVKGFHDVQRQSMQALMEAVVKQPVSVAIEADQQVFQLYRGGILSQSCGTRLDHGVLLVGYGSANGVPFWKVKNSWGESWGEHGYIRMKRGATKDGECGIQDGATYPVVARKAEEEAPEQQLEVAV